MAPQVLIVDDEPMVREVVARYLELDGVEVHEAGDGREAQRWLDNNVADLVVLDVMLPEIDGLSILRRLRVDSNVPVILLTARADEVDRITGLELGADDYVVKPFSPASSPLASVRSCGGRRHNRRRKRRSARTSMAWASTRGPGRCSCTALSSR